MYPGATGEGTASNLLSPFTAVQATLESTILPVTTLTFERTSFLIQTFSTAIPYAVRSDKFFFITSPLGNLNSIVPSILNITLSKPNP